MADAAPTGCYKCGRPGHWSRDCPDSQSNPNPNSLTSGSNPSNNSFPRSFPPKSGNSGKPPLAPKPKKVPRTRPKLTPELLLSDDGFGFILRYFPKHFKCRGRGHEVSDLGHLLSLYSEWHERLLPYYSFDQFIQRLERVAASRRVKTCISALRDKVARGGDPTKWHETPAETDELGEQDPSIPAEGMQYEGFHCEAQPSSGNRGAESVEEDLFHEIYDRATERPPSNTTESGSEPRVNENNGSSSSNEAVTITEEQRARIEANRLKALEKSAARRRLVQHLVDDQ